MASIPAPAPEATRDDPDPAADFDPAAVTLFDVLSIVEDIRRTLARIEGYLDGMTAAAPVPTAGRRGGRRHARHGAR